MMRKWLIIGAVAIALAGAAGWYHGWRSQPASGPWVADDIDGRVVNERNDRRTSKDDGVAEAADTIEPLVVENSVPARITPSSLPELEAPPVYLTPGMKQAPRPDAPRMPCFEDWAAVLPWPLEPLRQILEGTDLSKLKLFENLKSTEATEEAEPKEVTPPAELQVPMPDYHHQPGHCPYMGGRYPYPR